MKISVNPRHLAVAVAAGVVLAATAGGVGYAAGSSSKAVSACASSKGRLALLSSKGKCAKGFKKVSIAKQGPTGKTGKTGATGKAGATGKTGARGPGSVSFEKYNIFNNLTPVTVAGLTYTPSCSITGTGNSREVVSTLSVKRADGSGDIVFIRGVQFFGGDTGNIVSTESFNKNGTNATATLLANSGQEGVLWWTGALVDSGNYRQTVSMRIESDPAAGGLQSACKFSGTITPTG